MTFTSVRLSSLGDHSSTVEQSGQGLAEYALLLALVGVLAIVALTFMGSSMNNLLSTLGNAF